MFSDTRHCLFFNPTPNSGEKIARHPTFQYQPDSTTLYSNWTLEMLILRGHLGVPDTVSGPPDLAHDPTKCWALKCNIKDIKSKVANILPQVLE